MLINSVGLRGCLQDRYVTAPSFSSGILLLNTLVSREHSWRVMSVININQPHEMLFFRLKVRTVMTYRYSSRGRSLIGPRLLVADRHVDQVSLG